MEFKYRAKNWDNSERIERSKIVAEEINKLIKIKKNSSVMEYGCATGLIGFNLYNKFKKFKRRNDK